VVAKCANASCAAPSGLTRDGKLFRADVDIEDLSGQRTRKTQYVWLCSRCAETLEPTIEVNKDTVIVRLSTIKPDRQLD
jgi:uncharacterized metal-binding protein YceD (DUF177 family)